MASDNRMGWIRWLERTKSKKQGFCYDDCEFASECYIPGILDYDDGAIRCSLLTFEKDAKGLYYYTLRTKGAYYDDEDRASMLQREADKNGYYFKSGVAEELLSLFALYFQCRFYIVSDTHVPIEKGEIEGIRHRTNKSFIHRKVEDIVHPTIFSEKGRNFSKGLGEFLDTVKKLPTELHKDFLWVSHLYLKALRQVGLDTEMVFIRLVSAVEILSSKYTKIESSADTFQGKKLSEVLDTSKLKESEKNELEDIFAVRKSRLKFISFIEKYCTGFFKGGQSKAEHCKIRKNKLRPVLSSIYNARSSYLHRGESMYLSSFLRMKEARKWDTDPGGDMIIGNKLFSASEKLPYPHFFESLARQCFLNFLKEKSQP